MSKELRETSTPRQVLVTIASAAGLCILLTTLDAYGQHNAPRSAVDIDPVPSGLFPGVDRERPYLMVQEATSEVVDGGMKFSADGRWLLTVGFDGAVLWDVTTGRELRRFSEPVGEEGTIDADFSPDARYILTHGSLGILRVWEAPTGKELLAFPGGELGVTSSTFSPDSKHFVTGFASGEIFAWEIGSRTKRVISSQRVAENAEVGVISLDFTSSGDSLASSHEDRNVMLWDFTNGQLLKRWPLPLPTKLPRRMLDGLFTPKHAAPRAELRFAPDDRSLLITDGYLRIQNTNDDTFRELSDKDHSFTKSKWSPNGRWILSENSNGETWCLWEVSKGTIVRTYSRRQQISDIALDADSKRAIVANGDRVAHLLSIETGNRLQTFAEHPEAVTAVSLSRDGKWALTGCKDGIARLWHTATGKLVSSLHQSAAVGPQITAVCLSGNGGMAIVGDNKGNVALWQTATEKLTKTWKRPRGFFEGLLEDWSVRALRMSEDGTQVIAAMDDGLLRVWDVSSGRLVREKKPPTDVRVTKVALSESGRFFAFSSSVRKEGDTRNGLLEVRDTSTWRSVIRREHAEQRSEYGDLSVSNDGSMVKASDDNIYSLPNFVANSPIPLGSGEFSADGTLYVCSFNGAVTVYNTQTKSVIRELKANSFVAIEFRGDSQLITVAVDGSCTVLEPKTASVQKTFFVADDGRHIAAVALSRDGTTLAVATDDRDYVIFPDSLLDYFKSDSDITIWNMDREERVLACHTVESSLSIDCQFTSNGKEIVVVGEGAGILVHGKNTNAGAPAEIPAHLYPVVIGPSGHDVITLDRQRRTLSVWDFAASQQYDLGVLPESLTPTDARDFILFEGIIKFSLDGRWLLLADVPEFNSTVLHDLTSNKSVHRFSHESFTAMAVSTNGDLVATASKEDGIRVWDTVTGRLRKTIGNPQQEIQELSFIPGQRQLLATHGGDSSGDPAPEHPAMRTTTVATLWNIESGDEIRSFESESGVSPFVMQISPDGEWVITSDGYLAELSQLSTAKVVSTIPLPSESFALRFSPDGRLLMANGVDGKIRLWSVPGMKELCSIVNFNNGEWAVVEPEGRFDTSDGGNVQGLHWVLGDEAIELSQLKDRYYEPGLLDKILGNNPEPLRDVSAFLAPKLYPNVSLNTPTASDPNLEITLQDRGGGIGRVVVNVNGKEVTADARNGRTIQDTPQAQLTVALKDVPYLRAGDNQIEVAAYNAEGYLRSRGATAVLHLESELTPRPHLWAIACGVSDYSGNEIDLRFASKDAEEFGAAVKLAATRLFGADRTHVGVLSSSATASRPPTRTNLQAAFDTIARRAKPDDMLVIYLAGHGVNHGGENGDFHFLTAEARSASLTDPAVRQQAAISSEELTAAIKRIPALKQVMILDTCAAGNFVQSLSAGRSVPSSQIRALERLKDRTGLYVLAGCAADQVSYEASRYAQGLVTYSLLLGMRGAALREDQFVDVSKLFEYAADQVPSLARDVGGIQRPIIAVPQGAASFDIGQLSSDDRATIQLQRVRPLVLKARFQDEVEFRDTLGLAQRVNDRLRDQASGGREAKWVFVEGQDLPGALEVVGRYSVQAEQVTAKIRLIRDGDEPTDITVTGRRDQPDAMADEIVRQIQKYIERASATRQPQ